MTTTTSPLSVEIQFTKDGERTITWKDNDTDFFFEIQDYPEGDNRITPDGAESMNYFMNLLARAGYDGNSVII